LDCYGNIKLSIVLIVSIIGILISSAPGFSSSVSLTHEEQQWLSEHKTIRVSGPQSFPPFQFFDEEDEYVGMAADYLQYIAAQLDISVEYLPKTSWGKILELIQNKEIDVLSCAAYTKERSKYLLFSNPHIIFPLVIISRIDAPKIRKMQDIEGMRIALKKKISTETLLTKSQIPFTPHYISSPKDALKAVSLGQADITIENLAAASYIIERQGYTNLKIAASTDFENYALAIAIRKDWPLFQSIINKSLATISDQQHQEIRQRWFSVRYEHGITFIDILKWITFSLLLSSVVIGTIFLRNRKLTKEIGERKKIELRLRESERKLSTLLGNLPGMVYRCRNEREWPMEFVSDGCLDVTGFSPSEISKESSIKYGDIIFPDDRQYVWETIQEGVKKDRPFEMEYRIVAKSGNTKWVWERGGKVSDIQTHDTYLEGFIADITQQKVLANKLQQSQKMEAIGTLAGGIAHDFNNILASILGFSELALDEVEKGSTMEDNLQEIYAGGLRAKEIVKQILAFARHSDDEVKATRVDTIIIEALKLIRPSTPTTIEIRKEIDSSSLVMGNATQIHQIMMNLSTNAAHAMQDKGGIMEVSLKDTFINENNENVTGALQKGKYIKLAISDTGCGIAPEHIDSIFDPYFTTKETGEGTGMGLAMVQGIIDSYGGTITVESRPSQKTVFSIYLPVTSNLDNTINSGNDELLGGDDSILFVDDEPSIARMGSRILENLGYTVTIRTSSLEALELFRAKPDRFALVITDMTMPHMTGDKFALELKQIRDDIPIILCTGYSNKINAESALEIGINAFAYKPFSKADLASTVREVLDKV
jgi:two-component system cell cycle sensor histidine kinase/response regulator CckA